MPDGPLQLAPSPWWNKKWIQTLGLVAMVILGVYGLIYHDVVSRAQEAYTEGEKYLDWSAHPEKKAAYYESQFQSAKKKLAAQLASKKITPEQLSEQLETLEFDKKNALEESSLKYAYQWFKDTYELFSPPESKWVKMARVKAPEALALWKKELDAQKIPYRDTMFE